MKNTLLKAKYIRLLDIKCKQQFAAKRQWSDGILSKKSYFLCVLQPNLLCSLFRCVKVSESLCQWHMKQKMIDFPGKITQITQSDFRQSSG